jgi:hypothetical protein
MAYDPTRVETFITEAQADDQYSSSSLRAGLEAFTPIINDATEQAARLQGMLQLADLGLQNIPTRPESLEALRQHFVGEFANLASVILKCADLHRASAGLAEALMQHDQAVAAISAALAAIPPEDLA